jgi:nicotinamidase-related amidase
MARLHRLAIVIAAATLGCSVPVARIAVAQTGGAAASLPAIPDPVAVTLDASTTAFLALDFNSALCPGLPACVDSLPAVASGITAARSAGATVVYSSFPNATVLPDVLQMPGDPVVVSGGDKFYNTDLDTILQQHGIKTVVITGTLTNGAVLYTGFEASTRGYTVVVATDGVSARGDFATPATEWQLLNGAGTSNPQNMPLQAKAATLSRTDLISYR